MKTKDEYLLAARLLQGELIEDMAVLSRLSMTKTRALGVSRCALANPSRFNELRAINRNRDPGLKQLRQDKDKFLPALLKLSGLQPNG